MAIHGRPCRAVASASWSQVQSGMIPPPKVDATFGSPSSVTLPNQTPGSKRKRAILFLTRQPIVAQSTVTQSAS